MSFDMMSYSFRLDDQALKRCRLLFDYWSVPLLWHLKIRLNSQQMGYIIDKRDKDPLVIGNSSPILLVTARSNTPWSQQEHLKAQHLCQY